MIKGFRFTNQLANAEVDARIHQEFLNKNDGIFYGMDLSKTNNSITISEGLCEIAGRPVAVIGEEMLSASSENLYCLLVLEIDLSKESTKDTFGQAYFKLVTSSSAYPAVTQQEINRLDKTENIYQLEFARFRSGTDGITDFEDRRKFLNYEGLYNEIQKTIESIKNESAVAFKIDIKTGKEVATNEYVDGKKVYVKRINTGALPSKSQKNVEHNLNVSQINVERITGIAYAESEGNSYPLPFSSATLDQNMAVWISQLNIIIQTNVDRSAFTKSHIDIYYTKNNE